MGKFFWEYTSGSEESICYEKYTETQLSGNSVANSAVTIAVTGSSHPANASLSNIHLKVYKKLEPREDNICFFFRKEKEKYGNSWVQNWFSI